MIRILHARTVGGNTAEIHIPSDSDRTIDATGLLALPALIDPHVHFRVPGGEHKEDWRSGAQAAIHGGVTTVFDMPNTIPATITAERVREKHRRIDAQLSEAGIPLRYHLYLGGSREHLGEIEKAKTSVIGIKVFMGQSTGDLLMDDEKSFEDLCRLAARHDLIVAVHAEDETILRANQERLTGEPHTAALHSEIRSREAAAAALTKAIDTMKTCGNRLYVLHASTKEEVTLVREAKAAGLPIALETTPHHLFLTEDNYSDWGTRVQMNPPLRTKADVEALWEGIRDATIDTIGTDHAPHTLEEKNQPYGQAPSGVPGIETMLPLLLDAQNRGLLSLEQVVKLTHANAERIFRLPPTNDIVLVDMARVRTVRDEDLKTKCGWSPYTGRTLQGWPIYTVLGDRVFHLDTI